MLITEIQLELGKQQEDISKIVELAEKAAENRNLEGLKLIATNYPLIAARLLDQMELTDTIMDQLEGEELIQLYSRTKKHLNFQLRKKMLDKLIPFIMEKAKTIYRRGVSSSVSKYVQYQPGDTWETEMTIEKMLSTGKTVPDYESIVVKEPTKRKRSIAICIDKSLSVIQLIHQIVLLASVLSLSVKKDNFSIIEFDSSASILKAMNERKHPDSIIELILNIESGGKTNLEDALSLAQQQLMQSSTKDKIIYLISDLERTTGKNPLPIITGLSDLRVIYAKTYRRVSFVDDVISLPNVSMEELHRYSDLVELTSRLII